MGVNPVVCSYLKSVNQSDITLNQSSTTGMRELPLTAIVVRNFQPRCHFDPLAMEALTQSIRAHGILQPLLVRPIEGGKYELVAGERRYRVAQILNLVVVPVQVRTLSDTEALECALIENLQREELNCIEETESILQLLMLKLSLSQTEVISLLNKMANHKRKSTDNVVRKEAEEVETIFQSLGKLSVEAFRTHRLPLLNLPSEVLEALRCSKIKYTKAKVIASVSDPIQRQEILTKAITESLSLRTIQAIVKQYKVDLRSESRELQTQMDSIYKKAKQLKVWKDPGKQEKLKQLLEAWEGLLKDEELERE